MSQDQTVPSVIDPTPFDDAGFSVVEVIVAMSIFVIMTVAVLGILVSSLGGTRSNAQRVQAANIAAQQIEAVRSLRADQVPNGVTTPIASGTTVEGTTYTMTQSAAFLSGDGATSICTSTSTKPTFKRVTVTVTWPDMGATAPVRSDTVVSIGLGGAGLDETKGIAAVLVQDAVAAPVRNQLVSLGTSGAVLTDSDGCAVFANLVPGGYTAVVDTDTKVDVDGFQRHSEPIDVVAGQVRRVIVDYDIASTMKIVFTAPPGSSVPSGLDLPVTANFDLAEAGPRRVVASCSPDADLRTCATTLPDGSRQLAALFPGTYTAWAGTCTDADIPQAVNGGPPPVAVGPSLPGNVTVRLAGASITAPNAPRNKTVIVYALHAADGVCAASVFPVGTMRRGATLKVALPQGAYTFSLADSSGSNLPSLITAGSTASVSIP